MAASGCQGLRSLKVAVYVKGVEKKVTYQQGSRTLEKTIIEPTFENELRQTRSFTVRLYFAEPEDVQPGQRVFDVLLQGKTVLRDLDVVKEAGGPNRVLAKTFQGILAGNDLTIQLSPKFANSETNTQSSSTIISLRFAETCAKDNRVVIVAS